MSKDKCIINLDGFSNEEYCGLTDIGITLKIPFKNPQEKILQSIFHTHSIHKSPFLK
jgi:hypothetical protein